MIVFFFLQNKGQKIKSENIQSEILNFCKTPHGFIF